MVLSYENKTIQNAPLLKEIVELRHQAAKMLGYESHAAWTLEVRLPLRFLCFEDVLRY